VVAQEASSVIYNRRNRPPPPLIPFTVTETLHLIPHLRGLSFARASGFEDESVSPGEHLPSLTGLELRDWTHAVSGGQALRVLVTNSLTPYVAVLGTVQTLIVHKLELSDSAALKTAMLKSVSRSFL
jgi:hypothetical protein